MKRLITLLIATSISAPGFLAVGCDDTVHKSETVQRRSDGTVVTEREKTTRGPNGTVETTTEKNVDRTDRNP